ncbi:MAG: UDP-3-O-(3-hydroxymyristoyl)glucosamine N-acyltransferase [Pseudomonadota bacterium]|nr:UDP-3-O-(3-hydroxymyristoyl)glucosamine N-acyltransferase [Pseudomonadota bacterium]
MNKLNKTTKDIAKIIGCKPEAVPLKVIDALRSHTDASEQDVAFFDSTLPVSKLENCKAGCIITTQKIASAYNGPAVLLIHPNPKYAFAEVLETLYPQHNVEASCHTTAVIDKTARIDTSAEISANVTIGANVDIGKGVLIKPGVVIEANCVVGEGSIIHPNAVLYANTKIGKRCIIHSGASIGSDGFGYAQSQNGWKKLQHIGSVVLEDDVEIGANTCIDRGMLGETRIGRGAKLDNLIQIAHNVQIGAGTAIAACVGIAGSTVIGSGCMIGGAAKIIGHIHIPDGTIITAGASIVKEIKQRGIYGSPLVMLPRLQMLRLSGIMTELPKVWAAVKKALAICTI